MDSTISKQEICNITDPGSLAQTIENVQTRLKVREAELKIRLHRLPKESLREGLKVAATMVMPAFLTTKVAGASMSAAWNLTKFAVGKKKAVFPLIGAVVKAGFFSMLKKKVKKVAST